MTSLREQVTDAAFSLLEIVQATVTPAGGSAIEGVALLWLGTEDQERPAGMALQRTTRRRMGSVRLSEVPTLPAGSTLVAPELPGGADVTWKVDGPTHIEADHIRFLVVEA